MSDTESESDFDESGELLLKLATIISLNDDDTEQFNLADAASMMNISEEFDIKLAMALSTQTSANQEFNVNFDQEILHERSQHELSMLIEQSVNELVQVHNNSIGSVNNEEENGEERYSQSEDEIDLSLLFNEEFENVIEDQESVIGYKESEQDSSIFQCLICINRHNLFESESFGCEHLFCKQCLIDYFKHKILERKIIDIECPSETCDRKASETFIKLILPLSWLIKYEEVMLVQNTNNLPDINYCPECNYPVECDIDGGICSRCGFAFCTSCRKVYHGTDDCQGEAESAKKENEIAQSEELINNIYKKCPGCQINIEKHTIGCYHMTCARCSTQFCWRCLIMLSNDTEIEKHFSSCLLFDYDLQQD